MSERKLRVGMIGAGGISHVHCGGWTRLPECELVAIADTNPEAARKRAEEFKISSIEESAKRLLARKDIDAVDIVVPNRFHKEFAVMAMKSGKHVLCEKPLALSAAEVKAMFAVSHKTGMKLMAGQHMRWQGDTMALKEYTTKFPLGDVYYARAWYNRRRQLPCTPGFMYMKNAGGGCCIDVGVHVLDTALHLMDNFHPVSVTGVAGTKLAKREDAWSEWGVIDKKNIVVEDFAAGMIRFANGAALSLECSFMLNQKPKYEGRIDLFGTEAGAKWPELEISSATSSDFLDVKIDLRPADQPHHACIKAFAHAILGGTAVPIAPQQTLAVIAILEGLYKSQKTGKEVRIRI